MISVCLCGCGHYSKHYFKSLDVSIIFFVSLLLLIFVWIKFMYGLVRALATFSVLQYGHNDSAEHPVWDNCKLGDPISKGALL